jgi:hypothetical protein
MLGVKGVVRAERARRNDQARRNKAGAGKSERSSGVSSETCSERDAVYGEVWRTF